MALDIADPDGYEAELRATLAAFEGVAWPVFRRYDISKDAALVAFVISGLTGALLALAADDAPPGEERTGEPWR